MTAPMKHPRRNRPKKGDPLTSPSSSRHDIACDHALSPFNKLALEMEMMWGIDRLPELVSPDTASRYGYAIADLNAAYAGQDTAAVVACSNNCIKGMGIMDAEARAAGAQPATGEFWEYEIEGDMGKEPFRFAVMRDDQEWQTAHAKRPDLRMFTMREVANALQQYCNVFAIGECKDAFPGAQITKITPKPRRVSEAGDDFEF